MKLCISSVGTDISSHVDPRFGRCPYFLRVDTETMAVEVFDNPAFTAGGGAGIQAAQAVVNKGADVLITGNVGPNAFQALQTAGVKIVTGVKGPAKDIVERFKNGEFQYGNAPTVGTHHGSGR